MKTIEIVVDPKGEVIVQSKGFAGPSCRAASRFIESALGERFSYTSAMGGLVAVVLVGGMLVVSLGPEAHGVSFRRND